MKKIIKTIFKELLAQIVISITLIAIIAFAVWKIQPSESTIKVLVLAIYAIASFVGGMILGKVMEHREILWGTLAGMVYFGVILLIAFVVKGDVSSSTVGVTWGFVTSAIAGAIGGMLG